MTTPAEMQQWLDELSAALNRATKTEPNRVMADVSRFYARDTLLRYWAWQDARPASERGFEDLHYANLEDHLNMVHGFRKNDLVAMSADDQSAAHMTAHGFVDLPGLAEA